MNSTPIQPPDPYDRVRVERIEEKYKEPFSGGGGEEPPGGGLAAYLLYLLKKAIHYLLESSPEKKASGSNAYLLSLKNAFELLKREDRSEDIRFLNHLSEVWQGVLEGLLKWDTPLLKILIDKIQHYPENDKHTFGYYLTEYAGQKWVPFPYMELIQKIHMEHILNPSGSVLTEWTDLLDQLLTKSQM